MLDKQSTVHSLHAVLLPHDYSFSQNIEGGDAGDVIAAFTGAPYEVLPLSAQLKKKQPDPEPVWRQMLSAERSGFMLTASVPDHPTVDLLRVR
jgi:hypothetical protein